MRTTLAPATLALAFLAGCGGGDKQQGAFPDLHPVTGTVKRGGQPVKGGVVRFIPDPDKPEFLVNSEVKDDGTFTLTTVRTTDSKGERKPGAAAGAYTVTYTPALGDQAAGGPTGSIELPKTVTVTAGPNDITVDLPKK